MMLLTVRPKVLATACGNVTRKKAAVTAMMLL